MTHIDQGTPSTIDCQGGQVIADNLIIAVNGFMPSLGLKKDRVFPLLLTASLTRPLSAEEQQKMNHAEEWGVLSASPMGATVRHTQDKRIMIRNTVEVSTSLQHSKAQLAERRKTHVAGLKKRFDFLDESSIEYSWSGVTCISYNNANVFEQIGKNRFLIGCYNGGGIGLATLFGQQAALKALDKAQPVLNQILSRPKPTWLPPQPFLNIGVATKLFLDGRKGKSER